MATRDRKRSIAGVPLQNGGQPTENGLEARARVLDLEGIDFVHWQGAATLSEIHRLIQADGVTLRLARVKPSVLNVLRADRILELIGSDHIHGNVNRAIEAQLADGEMDGSAPRGDAAGAAS